MNTNIKNQWLAEMQEGKFETTYHGLRIAEPLTPIQYLTDLYRRQKLKKGAHTRWNRTLITNELTPGVRKWAGLNRNVTRMWTPVSHRSISLLGERGYSTATVVNAIQRNFA